MRTLKGSRTLPCDNTVVNKRRVKWSAGVLTLAGATDAAVGITDGNPFNGYVAVISPKTEDGVSITSSGTIGVGAATYAAANGQVSASNAGGALLVGTNWAPNVTAGADTDIQLA